MPKICYVTKVFSADKQRIIDDANRILTQYIRQGFDLTLRQLYYQFVARDLFPRSWANAQGTTNNDQSYAKLGDIISDARLAGLIDWDYIVDRTRYLRKNQHWSGPSGPIKAVSETYKINKWEDQSHYVEVWVEKDALVGVLQQICTRLDVPFFSCRGYTSQTEMWVASQRLIEQIRAGKTVHIIHLGDHDPSGVDMSRDIKARLELFCGGKVHVLRAALNWVQIQRYNPPPNPAKVSDSRAAAYIAQYGSFSWELDALDPATLTDIIRRAVSMFRDEEKWKEAIEKEKRGRKTLRTVHDRWKEVIRFLKGVESGPQASS